MIVLGFSGIPVADAMLSYEDQGMSKGVEVKRVKEQWGGGVHRGGWVCRRSSDSKRFVGPRVVSASPGLVK